jgi:hypothetical protein
LGHVHLLFVGRRVVLRVPKVNRCPVLIFSVSISRKISMLLEEKQWNSV